MPDFKRLHLPKLCWVLAFALGVLSLPAEATSAPDNDLNLSLTHKKLPDNRRELRAVVTATRDDKELPVEGMLVNFFVGSVGRDGGYGNELTDKKGEAVRILDAHIDIPVDPEGDMIFFARSKHPSMPLLQDQVKVKDAVIEVSVKEPEPAEETEEGSAGEDAKDGEEAKEVEEEPKYLLQARLFDPSGDKPTPISTVKVDFEIVRGFGNITFGGDFTYTDEEGKVVVEFPEDVPVDSEGKVVVLVSLKEHDEYGTVSKTFEVPWGTPRAADDGKSDRALWASRSQAPVWLIVSANLAIVGIWGMLIYVLVLTRRIQKLGRDS